MEYIKKQRGYLLILAMILVLIVAFVGNLLVSMFLGKMGANQNDLKSNAALYIATSGLEIAKRDIITNHVSCMSLNILPKYNEAPLLNGFFKVTGDAGVAVASLSSGISASDTSISLTSVSGFANNGMVVINNELISYLGISGNTLMNAKRGVSGTIATAHSADANVVQNQCAIMSYGGIPSLSSPSGKRIIQQTVFGTAGFTYEGSAPITPTIVSLGSVTIHGKGQINSPLVTANSPGFIGANVVTASTVNINGQGITQINSGSGSLAISSDNHVLAGDIVQNYSGINITNLFTSIFNASKSIVKSAADVVIDSPVTDFSTLSGYSGQTIWINGGINLNGNGSVTVGTSDNPVILIVDGDVNLTPKAHLIVYGIFYVIGSITDNAGYIGHGQTIVEGSITFKGDGVINLDYAILSKLGMRGTYMRINYSSNRFGCSREIFT